MEKTEAEKYRSIGARIKQAREAETLTQSEVALSLGYKSPTAISLIESGERRIQINDLEKLAKLLHRSVSYFIQGDEMSLAKPSVKIALRAEKQLDDVDVKRVESFIDALILSKSQDGRQRPTNK